MKTKIFAFAALITMLASCTVEVTEQSLTGKPITVTADVDKLMTRAGYEGTSVLPETFYLSLDQSNDKYDYTDMLMTKSSDGNVYTPASQLLWAGSADATVTAATFSLSGEQELSVATDQSTSDALQSSDHLFMAGPSVTPSSEGIAVEFGHLMSKVFITITLGDEFEEEENPITAIAVKGTVPTRSYTAGSGWSSLSATAADIIPLENVYTAPTSAEPVAKVEYEVILVPQGVAARGFVVSFSIGARKFKWTAPAGITLESGCQYTLDISAGKNKAAMGATSVRDWNCIALEGGDAEEVEEEDDEDTETSSGAVAIDLGLSVKWASCNVGATSPEEYGGYYAWGETEEQSDYSWSTYKWGNGDLYNITKYCTSNSYGTVDNKTTLDLEDDVTHVQWGGNWRMPTKAELDELRNSCSWSWTSVNGINGYQVTGPNGNSIFLPAAGYRSGEGIYSRGTHGYYWSASLDGNTHSSFLGFYDGTYVFVKAYRYCGHTVRPVMDDAVAESELTYTVNGVSFKMIAVEGGTFTMGSSDDDSDAYSNEKPAHQVTLSSYTIGETEVTQELWEAVMGSNPSNFTGNPQRPVEYVNWNDCQSFIAKLNELTGENFRLPTEAEWEYAALGGNASEEGYKYSGSNTIGDVAWYWDNSAYGTKDVKTKLPNELGIYDMNGNVNEWCADWYSSSYYASSPQNNPMGPSSGSGRVLRGGSWSNSAKFCRVAYRRSSSSDSSDPDYRDDVNGLRLAQ